jgi:hypothetical protein
MGYSRDDQNLTLGADDIAGITYLYPDPAYVSEDPNELNCGAISPSALPTGSTNSLLITVLVLFTFPLFAAGIPSRKSTAG